MPLTTAPIGEPESVRERVKLVLGALGAVAIGVVLYVLIATLANLYPGTGSGWWGPPERLASAQVGACERIGPISRSGLGYWWRCEVTVRTEDGRVVQTTVDGSIVTPADVGRPIEFREACETDSPKDCSYGRPAARGWKVVLAAVGLIEWAILAGIALFAALCLVRAALGRDRYARLYDAWAGNKPKPT